MQTHVRAFIEYEESNVTHLFKEVDLGEEYELLGLTVGMPGRHYPKIPDYLSSTPKGLPATLSIAVREIREIWGSDGYSSSWLSLAEVEKLAFWHREACGHENRKLSEVVNLMRKVAATRGPRKTPRLIFWFETEDW